MNPNKRPHSTHKRPFNPLLRARFPRQAGVAVPTFALAAARQLAALGLPRAAMDASLTSWRVLATVTHDQERQVDLAGWGGHAQSDAALRAATGELMGARLLGRDCGGPPPPRARVCCPASLIGPTTLEPAPPPCR